MRSASSSEKPIGFSHQHRLAELERQKDRLGVLLSGVETKTAVTSGCSIDLRVAAGVEVARRPARERLARAGSLSDTARKPTDGCFAASRARSVPMRPAPMTAMPMLDCFFMPRPAPSPVWRVG